jgi:response regulator RpfG family c-di-GMP phosphodiesterase
MPERHRADVEEPDEAYVATMETLAYLVEAKDADTRRHLERTSVYGIALTRLIDPDLAGSPGLAEGFLLHDIGKVSFPERILTKPGPLYPSEWARMRTHPRVGAEIVSPIGFLREALDVIRHHHEKFDGSGYPDGLAGDDIPLAARIFAVVDAFDAMTTDRPYRRAMTTLQAIEEIARCSGRHFDPEIVEPFLILADGLTVPAAIA